MTLFSRFLIAAATTAAIATTPAIAADYDPPIVVDKAPEFVPVEVGNGWYLRGDIGYSFGAEANGPASYRVFNAGVYTPSNFTTSNFDNNYVWGVGFGYQFNRWLRADATVEGQDNDFNGLVPSAVPCAGGIAGDTCSTTFNSNVTTYSILANLYGDLGTYVGFTPYVGAGAGMSRVQWGTVRGVQNCVGAGCPAVPVPVATTHAGLSTWRFTYGLMAGVAYDITRNMKIDLSYKFRHITGGDMFNFDGASTALGAAGVQGVDDGFMQHEVKVGVRYSLW